MYVAFNSTKRHFDISMTSFYSDAANATTPDNCSVCYSPSPNTTEPPSWFSSASAINYMFACFYWMISIIGIPGNLLAVSVVAWKLLKSVQHRPMTIFVGSLAISDLGLLLWVTWINAFLSVDSDWKFGKGVCQMYIVWRSLTGDCSIMTLMFIALDRCVHDLIVIFTGCPQKLAATE